MIAVPASGSAEAYRQATRAARVGIAANVLLAGAKFTGGVLGHSTALIADAFHSLTDVVSSTGLAWSLRTAAKPADLDHPYGHGKIESIAASLIAGVLMLVVIGISYGAWDRLRHPALLQGPTALALVVALGSIAVKEALFQYKISIGRRLDSASLIAEAWHHRSDAFSSIAATLGIGGAIAGGQRWRVLDPLAAFVVAGIMAVMAVSIFRRSTLELMDTQVPPETLEAIRRSAAAVTGVLLVEKTHARKSGLNILVEIHIEVDDHMTVRQSHRLGHDVEERIRREVPRVEQVLVHIEPHHEASQEGRRPIDAR